MARNILTEKVVVLNRNYQAIEEITVEKALGMMFSGAAEGMCVNGANEYYPVSFEEWKKLEIRDCDAPVRTPKFSIRAPRVVRITSTFSKIIARETPFTLDAIAERDGYRDYVTGEILPRHRWSKDHIVALHLGGEDIPENTKLLDRERNSRKGHKRNEELGWPTAPAKPLRKKWPWELIKPTHPDHEAVMKI